MLPRLSTALLLALCACGEPEASGPKELPEPAENRERDILETDLHFDLEARSGKARLTLAGDSSRSGTLEVGDLLIHSVTSQGRELLRERDNNLLHLGIPESEADIDIEIEYEFSSHEGFEGYRSLGSTLTWPTWCGNLFPCKSETSEGVRYSLNVEGLVRGDKAIYPPSTTGEAPAYMVAFAVGAYAELALGTTSGGTEVKAFYLPGGLDSAEAGTAYLKDYVEFFETTYGPYSFGDTIASVSVNWGFGAAGGIEHHPYFHVSSGAMNNHEVQAHETAHGWFGNGVRMACWEDLVLSEGVAQYLTLRAIEAAEGIEAAEALWTTIEARLANAVATGDTIAYPMGCNEIDILTDPLWSRIPYEKGAFFLRAVEERIGRSTLDEVLSEFYRAQVGKAVRMQALLDAIANSSPSNIDDLEAGWLRSLGTP